jgi:small subunit ribosomal protein S1
MMDKGVVVDLGHDLEGFAPMSQLGHEHVVNPADVVQEGQVVDAEVIEVDPIHHRIVVAVRGYPADETGAPPRQQPIVPPPDEPAD